MVYKYPYKLKGLTMNKIGKNLFFTLKCDVLRKKAIMYIPGRNDNVLCCEPIMKTSPGLQLPLLSISSGRQARTNTLDATEVIRLTGIYYLEMRNVSVAKRHGSGKSG